jgi:hypothetical protein
MIPSDLAPGDAKSLDRDWSGIELHRIESEEDPLFEMAFGALWAEFGAAGEVEQAPVLSRRMLWDGHSLVHGCALRYRMMLLTSAGKFAAVRDHTAIVQEGKPGAVVHLSHNLVAPAWRRSGLAGWLRALPVQTARNCLEAQHRPADSPIVLVGEMEHPDPDDAASLVRLKAYERAGYKKVDPRLVNYLQPDFRPTEEIDLDGKPRPLPMALVIRRVDRETETEATGAEIREITEALFHMYATNFRERDMAPLFASLENYPKKSDFVPLLPPMADTLPCL